MNDPELFPSLLDDTEFRFNFHPNASMRQYAQNGSTTAATSEPKLIFRVPPPSGHKIGVSKGTWND